MLAERANWSLNKTLTLTGVALMHFYHFLKYLSRDSFEWASCSNGFLQKEKWLSSGCSESRNMVQILLSLPVLYFSNMLSPFAGIHMFSQILSLLCQSKQWWKEEWSRVHEYLLCEKETLTSMLSSREILFRPLSGIRISCGKIPEGGTVFWSWTASA